MIDYARDHVSSSNVTIMVSTAAPLTPQSPNNSFLLRQRTDTSSNWIIIRPVSSIFDSGGSLAPDIRVDGTNSNQTSEMPKIRGASNNVPVITAEGGAHHYWLVGLDVGATSTVESSTALIAPASGADTAYNTIPKDIVIDRCYIHGNDVGNFRRGIMMNGVRWSVINSYLSNFHDLSATDTQAILGWSGPGPLKISNNYLEATGESVNFGGVDPPATSDPALCHVVPSDITVEHNYFSKPVSWKPLYRVKNLFESKSSRRVLVSGNVFENNWDSYIYLEDPESPGNCKDAQGNGVTCPTGQSQDGTAILLKSTNQEGNCPWCVTEHLTFKNNIVRHTGAGLSIIGKETGCGGNEHDVPGCPLPDVAVNHIKIENNLFYDLGTADWGKNGRAFLLLAGPGARYGDGNPGPVGPRYIKFIHNTVESTYKILGLDASISLNFTFRDNIMERQPYGFQSPVTGSEGTVVLQRNFHDAQYPNDSYDYRKNLIVNNSDLPNHITGMQTVSDSDLLTAYPQGQTFVAHHWDAVGFVDRPHADYRLLANTYKNLATDGTDLGCNITDLYNGMGLQAPTNLVDDNCGGHLTWLDNSTNETGYRIESEGGSWGHPIWIEIGTVGPNVTEFYDPQPNVCGLGNYRVRAIIGDVLSIPSNEASYSFVPIPCECYPHQEPPPQFVEITSPYSSENLTAGNSIGIAATTSGSNPINKVEFFESGKKLGESLLAPYNFAWNDVSVGAYALTARSTDSYGFKLDSDPVYINVNNTGSDTVWVDEQYPLGANAYVYSDSPGEQLTWVGASPAPYSGGIAAQSQNIAGFHTFYFTGATQTLSVGAGDKLFAYVYLDPLNTPSSIMLQWNDGTSFEHRAYWGANVFTNQGTNGTNSRRYMGPLPSPAQWVRLEVPASLVGLEGATLNGMAFTMYGGRVTWDYAGKSPRGTNVALASNGATANASSYFNGFAPSGAINGDRKGLGVGNNGYWSTSSAGFPAWLEVDFSGAKTISEIDLFTVQDNYGNPSEPTSTMSFTQYGITNFEVQYWTGTTWADISNGSVTGNSNIWRQFFFAAITTNKIRVLTSASSDSWSRLTEVEAYTSVPPPPTNFALSANGATASASSYFNGFAPSGAINGDRKGLGLGNNGYWSTASAGLPAWIEVDFSGSKTIKEIDVITEQDNYTYPFEPTQTMTFSQYGITAYEVQYWNGAAWVDVTGGNVTGNNLVWRKFRFAPLTTNKIRVLSLASPDSWSRVMEIEAWGN